MEIEPFKLLSISTVLENRVKGGSSLATRRKAVSHGAYHRIVRILRFSLLLYHTTHSPPYRQSIFVHIPNKQKLEPSVLEPLTPIVPCAIVCAVLLKFKPFQLETENQSRFQCPPFYLPTECIFGTYLHIARFITKGRKGEI